MANPIQEARWPGRSLKREYLVSFQISKATNIKIGMIVKLLITYSISLKITHLDLK
jgi:hypothetical protein